MLAPLLWLLSCFLLGCCRLLSDCCRTAVGCCQVAVRLPCLFAGLPLASCRAAVGLPCLLSDCRWPAMPLVLGYCWPTVPLTPCLWSYSGRRISNLRRFGDARVGWVFPYVRDRVGLRRFGDTWVGWVFPYLRNGGTLRRYEDSRVCWVFPNLRNWATLRRYEDSRATFGD